MDILGQSSLLVALTSFALGFSVLARNVKNKLFLTFAVVCTFVSGWAMSFFLDLIWNDIGFYRLHLVFNVWLAPAAIYFIQSMVRVSDVFGRRLFDTSLFGAIALTAALILGLDNYPWVLQLVLFSPGFILVQLIELMWLDRKVRMGGKRRPKLPVVGLTRRNLVYLGAIFVMMFSVMDHVPWLGRDVASIGNLGLTVYLFFISQAISQQRFLNFEALVTKFLVLLVVALTLTGVYWLLVSWIENSPGLFFLNSFIASFIILMLLDPLRALVRHFTARLLTQKHRRLDQILRDGQRTLSGTVDPGALLQSILIFVEQTLQPQWAALFILRSNGIKFRRVRTIGTEPKFENGSPLKEVLASHMLLRHCTRLQQRGELPVLLDQLLESEIDRSASRAQREYLAGLIQGLKALGCNLMIPLVDGGRILGFVTLYAPNPPEPWGNNWGLLQIIYPYFEHAAQTMRNMDVYVRQREKERLATLGEMSAGLAHEIRNPLGAIKGAAQFLDPSADKPESRFLRVIIEEVDRLNRVVTQFLDYSKPEATDFKRVELSALVGKCVELIRPGVRPEVRLEFFPSPVPAAILASSEKIQQVMHNLVGNSLKALEGRPSGRIRVSVEIDGIGNEREIGVIIEDDGPGIKKENLDKLFIPFFTTSPSGTGLGLSICQKIIEAHRGRIEVSSEEGKFARFTVILPMAFEPATETKI